jgi:apolipoprotein N-acyltransferase
LWPEGAYPWIIDREHTSRYIPRLPPELKSVPILMGAATGCNPDEDGWCTTLWNSVYLYTGQSDFDEKHDKLVLVPLTEEIPYPSVLGFIQQYIPPFFGRTIPGKKYTMFRVQGIPFAAMICFESLYPELSRIYTKSGAQFLVNITNDAWFGDSIAPFHHLSFLCTRAIENRRSMIQCAQTGISGYYDQHGRMHDETNLNEQIILCRPVTLNDDITFYTRYGDIIVYVSWCVNFSFLVLALIKKWFNINPFGNRFERTGSN